MKSAFSNTNLRHAAKPSAATRAVLLRSRRDPAFPTLRCRSFALFSTKERTTESSRAKLDSIISDKFLSCLKTRLEPLRSLRHCDSRQWECRTVSSAVLTMGPASWIAAEYKAFGFARR